MKTLHPLTLPMRRAIFGGLCALSLLTAPAPDRYAAPLLQTEPTVVINEVLAHADDPYVDAVELFNPCLLYTSRCV